MPSPPGWLGVNKAVTLARAAEGVRRIHCTEVITSDILPFLEETEKLNGTGIEAVALRYQQESEKRGDTHWGVLSPWLGEIVRKTVVEGCHVKSTRELIAQAVNGQNLECLLAKTLWVMPLLSSKEPKHWVTGWIDWSQKKVGIFDSIPQQASSSWAEPLFLKVVDHILQTLGRDLIPWRTGPKWELVIEKLPPLECQMDDWSCGFYVLMRIRAIAEGILSGNLHFSETMREEIRREAIEFLIDLPIIRYSPKGSFANDDELVELLNPMGESSSIDASTSLAPVDSSGIGNGCASALSGLLELEMEEASQSLKEKEKIEDVLTQGSSKSDPVPPSVKQNKRPLPRALDEGSDSELTDEERKKQK
ncbi:hypothetical protein BDN72DRAFT_905939 [Pluteus cervinus]|uniref:Uncharacterized protein n=1 Tax=Pluteus cervinus TaxID=181527 RepID=A0ACD3A0G8_9AGAR|nr:hypothetical protein BDN72DRAFT_905939 [Pluteus cervinus]